MTALSKERRVGEAKLSREMVQQVARLNGGNYVGELAADWIALTAEIERLRKAVKLHADGLGRAGQGYFAQSLRAVLANTAAGAAEMLAGTEKSDAPTPPAPTEEGSRADPSV